MIDPQSAAARGLVKEQLDFHTGREALKRELGEMLGHWGITLFVVTLVVVAVKLALLLSTHEPRVITGLGLAAALLAAGAAALFGIRAYEEMELLAEPSERMLEVLTAAKTRIELIDLNRPLASQLLGNEVFEVAMLMLADGNGWAQLFRMKAIGVG